MTMTSSKLKTRLQELPGRSDTGHRTSREHLTALTNTDRGMHAAEHAAATSFGLWSIFSYVNVDDSVAQAYQAQYPGMAEYHSIHDHWQEMINRGSDSMTGFISGIKGKVAEFGAADQLREAGWTGVETATDPTQSVFDITGIPPGGQDTVQVQVKTGAEQYASEVQDAMAEAPDVHFMVSSEIYDRISESTPEAVDQMTDIGTDWELTQGIQDGLETLTSNLGIDVPDSLGELLPYAGAILTGARLIYSVMTTEMEFKDADRSKKNKLQVLQTLTLMSRIGISTALSVAGGQAGTAIGSVVPGVGNIVAGTVGSLAGAGIGMYLNKHLQPHMLRLGLNICGMEDDDLFYLKNKSKVDQLAFSFQRTANQLKEERPT